MASARMATQLVCSLPTRVGLLADIAESLRQANLNVIAISAYERNGEAKFLLVTSDNAEAAAALGRFNADVREKSIVLVDMPNKAGALEDVAKKIAEAGVNVEYSYGTAGAADTATVVFKTADDAKVASLFG